VAARLADVPAAVAVACAAVVFILTLINRRDIYLWFSVLLFFFAVSTVMRPRAAIPQGGRLELVAQIAENPTARGRWQVATARVGHYRADGGWHRVNEKIQLSVDTCYTVAVGDQIAFRAWVNPIDSGSYGALMALRGMHSRAYLVPGNLLRKAPHSSHTPAYFAARLQQKAVERLERLHLKPASRGVVEAMTAGYRGAVGREVRAEYSATGAAHLLAVSGLHVGIVFVLVNLLLYALPALRRGNIYRNLLAVAAIWIYAMASGLSPSVVRAALMFSFAQLALASGSHRNGLNIMLGSAVVMLALNPNYWGDMSFMMSYAAVLSIAAFFGPLYRLLKTRHKALNALISVMIVGVAASAGTAPLVAYWFGQVPLAGMVFNPAVILTAHIIVAFGVVWMVASVGVLNPVFSTVLDGAASVQNAVVGWGAARGWAAVEVSETPLWVVVAAYLVLGALAVWLKNNCPEGARK
jgi:competence protein ComEC